MGAREGLAASMATSFTRFARSRVNCWHVVMQECTERVSTCKRVASCVSNKSRASPSCSAIRASAWGSGEVDVINLSASVDVIFAFEHAEESCSRNAPNTTLCCSISRAQDSCSSALAARKSANAKIILDAIGETGSLLRSRGWYSW